MARDKNTIMNCWQVPEDEDPTAMLERKLDLYADEPEVHGEVVSKKIKVMPGVTATVSFVVLRRTRS